MKTVALRIGLIIFSIVTTSLLFQNCGQKFDAADEAPVVGGNVDLGSGGGGGDHQTAHITPASTKIEANTDLEFSVFSEALLSSASYQWSHTLNNVASSCALKNGNKATNYIINCSQAGTLNVSVTVTEGNTPKVIPAYSVVLPPLVPSATEEIKLLVAFTIPAGIGSAPWNTTATVVETFIGQTLKFTNMDNIRHQMHTNGKPCSHGSAMASGASTNCVIGRAYDYKTDGALYDHDIGTKAAFYMVAYDGSALYTKNCAGCHGALSVSTKAKAKVSAIKNALATVPTMQSNASLTGLTQRQLEAISYALGAR